MPTLVDLGETWYSPAYEVRRASDGALTSNATLTATVSVDGTTSSVPVPNTGTGTWAVDYTTSVLGQHDLEVTATGGDLGAGVLKWTDTFVVVPRGGLLVSADDALTHLRARSLVTAADDVDQLRWLCLVATDAIARDLDRAVVRETVTEKHTGGACTIRLRRTPVAQVTAVAENGTALTGGEDVDWHVDDQPSTGLLHRGSPLAPRRWACGRVTVTYVAHLTPPPPILRSVALGVVEQMFQAGTTVPRSSFDQTLTDAALYTTTGQLPPPERAAYEALRATSGLGIA